MYAPGSSISRRRLCAAPPGPVRNRLRRRACVCAEFPAKSRNRQRSCRFERCSVYGFDGPGLCRGTPQSPRQPRGTTVPGGSQPADPRSPADDPHRRNHPAIPGCGGRGSRTPRCSAVLTFLVWCVVLFFFWPLALVALILYPLIWLLLLPFRIVGIAVGGALDLVWAIVTLPARVLRRV